MQARKSVADLVPGDFIYSINGRRVDGTYVATEPLRNGARVVGPRGGRYTLHQPLAAATGTITGRVVVVTSTGRPVVADTAVAVVEAPEEW